MSLPPSAASSWSSRRISVDEPLELAPLGQWVEDKFVGVACGILDQYTSVLAMHDAMTDAPGLIARRQAGAGFGGCLVAIVDRWELGDFPQS